MAAVMGSLTGGLGAPVARGAAPVARAVLPEHDQREQLSGADGEHLARNEGGPS
jgi:hypothetical protein